MWSRNVQWHKHHTVPNLYTLKQLLKYWTSRRISSGVIMSFLFSKPWQQIELLYMFSSEGRELRKHCDYAHKFSEKIIQDRKIALVSYIFIMFLRRVRRYQREVIRIRKSKKNRQHNDQKKTGQKNRQHNDQKKKYKRTDNTMTKRKIQKNR